MRLGRRKKIRKIQGKDLNNSRIEPSEFIPIVFVHLNGLIPRYLYLNIERTVKLFPNNRVILLVNSIQKPFDIEGLTIYHYIEDEDWKILSELLKHPQNFRNNFWFTSLARFLVLRQFLINYDNSILHVESDVLLARDFPFTKLSKITESLAFPIVSNERGVASTVYFKNLAAATALVQFTLTEARNKPTLSDMILLRLYYNENKNNVCVLPIGPLGADYYNDHIDNDLLIRISKGVDYFGGIFDGNDIGVYFFGTNPVNLRGRTILRKEIDLNYANVRNWVPKYNRVRKFINILQDEKPELPIYSIHAAVKSEELFSFKEKNKIMRKRIKDYNLSSKKELLPKIFISQFKIAFLKRARMLK